ncbi:hypothetical protein FB570_1014 [Streptomyces sp. T12]|nr:hypothetical protein FB570_1014 [Streptomyces sp. T12]
MDRAGNTLGEHTPNPPRTHPSSERPPPGGTPPRNGPQAGAHPPLTAEGDREPRAEPETPPRATGHTQGVTRPGRGPGSTTPGRTQGVTRRLPPHPEVTEPAGRQRDPGTTPPGTQATPRTVPDAPLSRSPPGPASAQRRNTPLRSRPDTEHTPGIRPKGHTPLLLRRGLPPAARRPPPAARRLPPAAWPRTPSPAWTPKDATPGAGPRAHLLEVSHGTRPSRNRPEGRTPPTHPRRALLLPVPGHPHRHRHPHEGGATPASVAEVAAAFSVTSGRSSLQRTPPSDTDTKRGDPGTTRTGTAGQAAPTHRHTVMP